MKTKKLTLRLLGIILVSSMVFTACRKNTLLKEDDDAENIEANDQSFAENASNDIMNIGSQATDNNGSLSSYKISSPEETLLLCAMVKRDSIRKIDSVIFNNSTCIDGRLRSGMLIFNYSASSNGAKHYRDPGFKCTVTSLGYTVDDRLINIIDKTIENTTAAEFNAASTNLTWKITGHIQVTKSKGGTHDVSFTRYKTLLNTSDANVYHGKASPISWNLAKIGLTGNATGVTAKGRNFNCQITKQLVRDFGGCTIGKKHPFIQGTLEFTPGDRPTRTVDFGEGTCDLDATVTVNGKVHPISLK
jgi:hypothetical protein